MKNLIGALLGFCFGYWLQWVGFTDYDVIVNALLLQDFYLWGIFVLGLVTAAAGLRLLKASKARTWIGRQPIQWEHARIQRSQLLGSALFGVGWAITGTCPGPAIAQAGSGHLAGLWTLAGILIGVALSDALAAKTVLPTPAGPG